MLTSQEYFIKNNLFDFNNLKHHCEEFGVWINTSERFPNLVLLKYKDEVQWGDKPWTEFTRMCRGLVVDMKNQVVLSHGFDKFFNLDQMPETKYAALMDRNEFEVSEKLDGSCLLSYLNPNDNLFYVTTTGSLDSEHGKVGTELFRKALSCPRLAAYAAMGTLIFELIDSRFRIVIDYKMKEYSEGLYLIGYRTHEGELYPYAQVAEIAKLAGLPCPKSYSFINLWRCVEYTKNLPMSEEGFVIRYPDGLMVKVKGAAYLKAHRFISQLSDKNILEALKEGVEEQMLEVAPDEFQPEIINKIAYFKSRKVDILNQCYKYFADAPKENGRKEFALWVNQNVPTHLKGCLFQMIDFKLLTDCNIYTIIGKTEKPSTETKI